MEDQSISDRIKSIFLDYIDKYDHGLVIAPLPTSIGKTYSACQTIADYVLNVIRQREHSKSDNHARKLVWITTLIKIIPEDDLKKAFRERNIPYDDYVIRVKSNVDCITEAIENWKELEKELPADISRCKEIREIKSRVREISSLKDKTSTEARQLLVHKQDELANIESKFRGIIHNHLAKVAMANKLSIEDLVYEHEEYEWISKIYPHVREKNYIVFLMTDKKLTLSKNKIIKKVPYLSKEWLKNAIVIIDESDATKADVTSTIVDNISKTMEGSETIDFKKLFLMVVDGLNQLDSFDSNLKSIVDNKTRKELINEANELLQKYKMQLSFKSSEGQIDRKDFLYYCADWKTIHKDAKGLSLFAIPDPSSNRVCLNYGKKEAFQEAGPGSFLVRKMLNDINTFLRKFVNYVNVCAINYQRSRNGSPEAGQSELSQEECLNTILYKYKGLEGDYLKLLLFFYSQRDISIAAQKYNLPYSFYRYGATWYTLVNGTNHEADTVIQMGRVTETAENVMSFLSENALVIAMSATANCPTILGNYNLHFLESELKYEDEQGNTVNNFHNILIEHPELGTAIKKELQYRYKKYHIEDEKQSISIETPILLENLYEIEGRSYEEIITEILPDNLPADLKYINKIGAIIKDAVDNILSRDEGKSGGSYFFSRYLNIARVMLTFAIHRNHQSCLCVNMALPGEDGSTLQRKTLESLTNVVNNYCKKHFKDWSDKHGEEGHDENIHLFIITSRDFYNQKDEYINKLRRGDRLFILSTFATVGAGINLQHPICEWIKPYLRRLDAHEKRDESKKDIDELAILDITNMVVNMSNWDEFGWKDQIRNIINVEECYENGFITDKERTSQIIDGFNAIDGYGFRRIKNILKATRQEALQAAYWLVQVDGRTKRTLWRNQIQTIYLDRKVFQSFDLKYHLLMKDYHSEELKKILDLREQWEREMERSIVNPNRPDDCQLLAQMKSDRARQEIHRMISAINLDAGVVRWRAKDAINWPIMRMKAAQHPTVSDKLYHQDRFYSDFYIDFPDGQIRSSYYYYQKNEYDSVFVGFELSKEDFSKKMQMVMKEEFSPFDIREVSEDRSRLSILMKYKGMEQYFEENGMDTKWKPSSHIVSPIIFQEMVLGAYGEIAGSYILKTAIPNYPIKVSNMPEDILEVFDGMFDDYPDVYADFKYFTYYQQHDQDLRQENNVKNFNKIRRKMEIIGAKAVFIVGVIAPDETRLLCHSENGNIYVVPALINNNGLPIIENIQFIINKLEAL